MKYRWLRIEEWKRLDEVRERCPQLSLLDPRFASVSIAEDSEGKIQGFLVLQLVPHAEPIWIDPEARDQVEVHKLVQHMETAIPPGTTLFTFSDRPAIDAIVTSQGMSELPWKVFKKEY